MTWTDASLQRQLATFLTRRPMTPEDEHMQKTALAMLSELEAKRQVIAGVRGARIIEKQEVAP